MTPDYTKKLEELCALAKKTKGDAAAGLCRHLDRAIMASKDLEPKPAKK